MSTGMVKVEPANNVPVVSMDVMFDAPRAVESRVPDDMIDADKRIAQVVTEGKSNWRSFVGQIVNVIGVTVFSRRTSPDGETPEKYGFYMCLHCDDGHDIVTSGKGPVEDMPLVSRKYGKPPWPNGARLVLTRVDTGGGKTRFGVYPLAALPSEV